MIELSWIDDVPVMTARGRLESEREATELERAVQSLVADGRLCFVIDVTSLREVGQSGVDGLRRCFHAARAAGGDLKLVGLPRRLRPTLALGGLLRLFEVYDTTALAVASFPTARLPPPRPAAA